MCSHPDRAEPPVQRCRPYRPGPRAAAGRLLLGVVLLALAPLPALAQSLGNVSGRVVDRDTDQPVIDATVTLVGIDGGAVTDDSGRFQILELPAGTYVIQIGHIAYGEFTDILKIEGNASISLRVRMSQTAIELEPIIVEARTEQQQRARTSGTRMNLVTREMIDASSSTSQHVGHVLRQHVSGVAVRENTLIAGSRLCIEFRGRSSVTEALGCNDPIVYLDGIRVWDPGNLYETLPVGDIEQMEVIPPSEAGVLYGTDTQGGVLLITTRGGNAQDLDLENDDLSRLVSKPRVYDWSVETEEHHWKRVFVTAFLANAAGIGLGLAAASKCIEFEDLVNDVFATKCRDPWATAGSRSAALGIPPLAVTIATRYAGSTSMSRGKFLQTLLFSSLVMIPGYALASSSLADDSSATAWAGRVFLLLGVPAAATYSDHIFRKSRGGDPVP